MAQTGNACTDFGYRDAYKAAIKGDLGTLMNFCSQHLMARINASGDTVFHILALNCHAKVFSELLLQLPLRDLMMMKNGDGDTALHEAARIGCLEIADIMLQKEANLITAQNKLGETPIFVAAACGQAKMLCFLFGKINCENGLTRNDGSTILHAAVMGEFYGLALTIMKSYPDLALACTDMGITALHLLAQSSLSFRSGTIYSPMNLGSSSFIPLEILAVTIYSWRMKQLAKTLPCIPWLKEVVDVKQKHKEALDVVKQLVAIEAKHSRLNYYINHCEDPNHSSASGKNSNEDPLLQAMKCGIIEVVQEILKEFPDAIEVRDRTGKNAFHIIAEYRQDKIFEFLKSKNIPMKKMLVEVDKEGNTPLHLAAKYGFYQQRHMLPVLHQMPWEIFWFKQVGHFSPPQTHHLQNAKGQTPKELFDETHKGLLQQSEKWVKDNTGVTMVISILIATLIFTAALTVPGGFDPNTGIPIVFLHYKNLTSTFFSLVIESLIFSFITLAIAIYAHSSRFQQEDFYISLPLKFLFGITTLLVCVILTVMAYAVTRQLESGGKFTHRQHVSGIVQRFIVSLLVIIVYIDITFPVYRYVIRVLHQSLSYHK